MRAIKRLAAFLGALFLSGVFVLYAQEDDFDFDAMFEDSEDLEEAVTSEGSDNSLANSDFFKSLTLTGSFNSEFGGFLNYSTSDSFDGGGIFSLENTLYLSARASKDLNLNGSFTTSLSNKFDIELNTLYFDYLMRDLIFITGGKRSFAWGYPVLFSNGDLYGSGTNSYGLPYAGQLYTNILEISSNHAVFQVKIPWTSGTLTAMALYDFSKLRTTTSWKYLSYAGSLEFTVLNQIINLFVRDYGVGEAYKGKVNTFVTDSEGNEIAVEDDDKRHPTVGIETKRTVLGVDLYAQSQARMQDYDTFSKQGIDFVIATAGFYKLWDSFEPNIGIVAEYQYVYDPNLKLEEDNHSHKIALEAGVRHLGKNKNLKFGIDWGHNFSNNSGTLAGVFYISNIFNHGQWKNLIGVSYGGTMETPKAMIGSVVSISMSY